MAAWLLPALKAALPHIASIVTATAPVFTKKTADAANQAALLQRQITELQQAASGNAQTIKELAEQLQKTLTALEEAASIAQVRLRRAVLLGGVAVVTAAAALALALVVLATR